MVLALCNMGDIVIIGNSHQKLFLREVGASSLLKLLLLLQRKNPLCSTKHGSLQVLTDL